MIGTLLRYYWLSVSDHGGSLHQTVSQSLSFHWIATAFFESANIDIFFQQTGIFMVYLYWVTRYCESKTVDKYRKEEKGLDRVGNPYIVWRSIYIHKYVLSVTSCLVKRCKTSQRMSHSCWWWRVSPAEWTGGTPHTAQNQNRDVVLHLCRRRGRRDGVVLPVQLAEGGKPLPLSHRHHKTLPIWSRWRGKNLEGFWSCQWSIGSWSWWSLSRSRSSWSQFRFRLLGSWNWSCWWSSFCSLVSCCPGSRLSLGSGSSVARTANYQTLFAYFSKELSPLSWEFFVWMTILFTVLNPIWTKALGKGGSLNQYCSDYWVVRGVFDALF